MNVRRDNIVDSVVAQFSGPGITRAKLMSKLSVKFEGEQGIDASGLTKASDP